MLPLRQRGLESSSSEAGQDRVSAVRELWQRHNDLLAEHSPRFIDRYIDSEINLAIRRARTRPANRDCVAKTLPLRIEADRNSNAVCRIDTNRLGEMGRPQRADDVSA